MLEEERVFIVCPFISSQARRLLYERVPCAQVFSAQTPSAIVSNERDLMELFQVESN